MTDSDKKMNAQRFYTSALTRAERTELPSAMSLEGLDGEIALLRIRLRRLAGNKPDEFALLLRGIGTLAKSLSVKYKLSSGSTEELEKEMLATVEELLQAIAEESPSAV